SDIAPWNELSAPVLHQAEWVTPGNKSRVYRPLFKRSMCESLEERMEYYAKRSKLVLETDNKTSDDTQEEDCATDPSSAAPSSPSSTPSSTLTSLSNTTTTTTAAAAATSEVTPTSTPIDV
ncbi:tRNA pseudouridine synthase, partial [Elysia marginata]